MHAQAAHWIREQVVRFGLFNADTVDLGGRDVNGTIHQFFHLPVTVVDIIDGPGVTYVTDAATWEPDREYQVALATEVFEHTPSWPLIIRTAWKALIPEGMFLGTCASRSRPAHSAIDGGPLREDEYYRNVDPEVMRAVMKNQGWRLWDVIEADGYFGDDDLYCWGIK